MIKITKKLIISLIVLFVFLGCQSKITNQDSKGKTIVCFGDSITEGFGSDKNKTYPDFLQKLLGMKVINSGISSNTTRDALVRIERDVLQYNPKLVIVQFHANDFFQKIPKEETFNNLEQIVDKIQNSGAMVVLVEIKVGLMSDKYLKGFKRLAKEKKALLITNIMKGILIKSKLKYDGFHPNSKGYKLIAERIHKKISHLLD